MAQVHTLLGEHFDDVQAREHAPQLAYGMLIDGEFVAAQHANVPFRIASMTKSFTAAAVLILRDADRLALDAPVEQYVPELKGLEGPTSDSPVITVRHLLTMSSGLATDDPWADRHLDATDEEMNQLFAAGGHFATAPGTQFVYSNYGYAILGRVITNVAGMPYQQFITDKLLQPLGMTATTWDAPDEFAPPHRVTDGRAVPEGTEPLADGGFAAMGGLWSTVEDLLRWTQFFADAYPARNGDEAAPLRRSSRREMQQTHTFAAGMKVKTATEDVALQGGYGMGLLECNETRLGRFINHTGGLPGYGSNMAWSPERSYAMVSLANVTYANMYAANVEALLLAEEAGHLPKAETPISASESLQPHAEALIDLFNDWTNEKAERVFAGNVALDLAYTDRLKALTGLTGGSRLTMKKVVARNAAVGSVAAELADGNEIAISFTLSSQAEPKIQYYEITKLQATD